MSRIATISMLRGTPSAVPVATLAAVTVSGLLAASLSRDARAVLSLTVPHLGGADGLLWPAVVLRMVVLALLVATLLALATAPVGRPASRTGVPADEEWVTRLIGVGRIAAVVLFVLTVVETLGAPATAFLGTEASPPGSRTVPTSHVLAVGGSVLVMLMLWRSSRSVRLLSGWALLLLAVTHLPLVLVGSWLGQPDAADASVAVVARAAWLLAVVLTAGPALFGLLAPAPVPTPAAVPPARRRAVPVTGVLSAGYAALLTVSAAGAAPALSRLLLVGACGVVAAVLVSRCDAQRARGHALVAVAVLAGVVWLVLPSALTAATSTPVPGDRVGETTHTGMAMGSDLLLPIDTQGWFTQWTFDPLFAPLAIVAIVLYLAAMVRLRRRGHRWPASRAAAWCLGWLLFAWATNGAPAVYGMALFSMHMVQHMTISMAAPAFLVLAAPISLAFRAMSPRADGTRGAREWLLTLVHSRLFRLVANPLVAPPLFVISLMVFYYSPLFELAMASYAGHVLMTLHFLLSGYVFAWVLVGIDPGPTRPPYPMRLMILIVTMAFHAFFGIVLMTGDVILAEDWFRANAPSWVDLAQDQYVGGALAWGLGDFPVGILSVALAFAWLRDDDRERRRYDRQADRDGDAALNAYNRYLGTLGQPVGRAADPPPRAIPTQSS